MPLYSYECRGCGPFQAWRSMSESDMRVRCPNCRRYGRRAVSAPRLGMNPTRRKAHAINERSQHEPRVVRMPAGRHGHAGHDHGNGAKKGGLESSRHPWMIRH